MEVVSFMSLVYTGSEAHGGFSGRLPDWHLAGHSVHGQPDPAVGADGPEVKVPHDVGGCLAREAGEALSQLIDRMSHAGEALGAGVGLVHESSILRIAGPRQGPSAT